jgi:ribosomal protein S18 acetylase RimI-like enzyme
MRIRKLAPPDRDEIAELLQTSGTFNEDEVAVALEVVDAAVAQPGRDYLVLVCVEEDDAVREDRGALCGYLCFGPTPMTEATYDLYWIATRADQRGRGVGTRLVQAMESEVTARRGRLVRIETSLMGEYDAARSFYTRLAYHEVGRIRDFYRPGDDLVTLAKRLDLPAQVAASSSAPSVSRA